MYAIRSYYVLGDKNVYEGKEKNILDIISLEWFKSHIETNVEKEAVEAPRIRNNFV